MSFEQTLIIIKPDGVFRGICGEIITRFERCGLKITAMKLVTAEKTLIEKHYPSDDEWYRAVGQKAKRGYEEKGLKLDEDDIQIGKKVKGFLINYMTSGPVLAMILEGNNAIGLVRKLVGTTNPYLATPGTIRGDYTMDDVTASDSSQRACRNMIHASGSAEEAKKEISLWFKSGEINKYARADEKAIMGY